MKRTGFKRRVSPKKAARDAIYLPMMRQWKIDHPYCQFEGCRSKVKDLHHMAGKVGNNYFRHFMSVCRRHHDWIHANTRKAREAGYLFDDDPRRE